MIRLECEYCGSEFQAERVSAKFCSDSHKVLFHRQQRRLDEIENKRQLQQDEFDEIKRGINEDKRKRKKQADDEFAERMRVADIEQRKRKEEQKLKDEKRRNEQKERQRVEREKRAENAALKFNLTGLGIISAIGLVNLFLNHKTEQNNVNNPDHNQSDSSNPDKMPDNHFNDE